MSRAGPVLARVLPPALTLALGVVVWEVYVRVQDVAPTVLPAPSRVAVEGWQARRQLGENLVPTLEAVALGMLASVVLAFVCAVAIDAWDVVRRALYPPLVISQTVPLFAVAPLLIRVFGFELTPKVVLVAVLTFFPMTVAWADGFAATRVETIELLRSFGADRWQVFRHGRLPSALPWFFSGLRVAVTYAVIAAVLAEFVGSREGLGIFIRVQLNQFRTDLALAAVVVTTVLTLALVGVVGLLRRWAVPWAVRGEQG